LQWLAHAACHATLIISDDRSVPFLTGHSNWLLGVAVSCWETVVHSTAPFSHTLAPAPASAQASPSLCLLHTKRDASRSMHIQVDHSVLSHVGLAGAVSDWFPVLPYITSAVCPHIDMDGVQH